MVGKSGKRGSRRALVVPRKRTLPASMKGFAAPSKVTWQLQAITSCSAGAEPL